MANKPSGPPVEPRPADPAPNRLGRREPLVIDSEATDLTPPRKEAAAEDSATREPGDQAREPATDATGETSPPVQSPRGKRWPIFVAALAGCIVGAAVIGAVFWQYAAQQAEDAAVLGDQLSGQIASFSDRIAKLEARPAPVAAAPAFADPTPALIALDRRLTSAEAALRDLSGRTNAAAANAQQALAAAPAPPAAPLAAAPAQTVTPAPVVDLGPVNERIGDVAGRVDQLQGKIAPLAGQIAALQQNLAAVDARADAGLAAGDAASRAIVAGSVLTALDRGRPYQAEFAALSAGGASAGALAALQPFAQQGAPTAQVLATRFAALTPAASAPPTAAAPGGLLGQISLGARSLVDIHAAGAASGSDPSALAARVSDALGRDDIAAALAAWAALPAPSQVASQDWAQTAKARLAADAAARAILTDAIGQLGHQKS